VDSVSTIGFVTVLTVWSLFLPLGCICSYGVFSVSTIDFVTETLKNQRLKPETHRKDSYKPNGGNRDHTVKIFTNPMVETETTP
jgi:hypothetical protein